MSRFPAIPDVQPGPNADVLRAMKEAIEIMAGLRGNGLGCPRVYHQDATPADGREGDVWIQKSQRKLAYFNGRTWEGTL